jgi:hypothetical protein
LNGLGGGDTAPLAIAIVPPPLVPTIVSLSPPSLSTGLASAALVVNGDHFVPGSRIRVDGVERATTFESARQLRTTLTAADLVTVATRAISVFTPAPGGGTSGDVAFPIVGASLTLNRTTAAIAGPFAAALATGPGRAMDWIGIFPASTTGAAGYVDWQWTSGGQSGPRSATSGTFTFPTNALRLAPGTYVARLISNNVVVAQSAAISLSQGTAPAISNMTFTPASVAVGSGTVRIDATLDFQDADGDVDKVRFTPASGPSSEFPIENAGGIIAARVNAFALVDSSVAGTYPFTVQLVDRAGNASNGLGGVFNVTSGGGASPGTGSLPISGGVIVSAAQPLPNVEILPAPPPIFCVSWLGANGEVLSGNCPP